MPRPPARQTIHLSPHKDRPRAARHLLPSQKSLEIPQILLQKTSQATKPSPPFGRKIQVPDN